MSLPPRCEEAVDRLWEYVRGDLDVHGVAVVERHLAHCLRCCGEELFVRELQRRLAGPPPSLPPDVEGRLERFLDDLEPSAGGTP